MNYNELPTYIETHNNVVTKILMGKSNWSATELQHYQNYPSEVERAIKLYNSGVSVSLQGCVYQSQRFALKMSWENYVFSKKTTPKQRHHNAVAYLAMALTFGGVEKKVPILVADYDGVARPYDEATRTSNDAIVAVAIVDNDNVDVAVVEMGNGVVEVKGIYGGKNISLDMACDMAWGMSSGCHIDRVYIVGNRSLNTTIQQTVYNHFHIFPKCFVIYYDLLELAATIFAGVLQCKIHDLLMCDVLSMPVGIRVCSNGKSSGIITLFNEVGTIPTKKYVEISMENYPFPLQVEVLQGDFKRTAGNRLWGLKTIGHFTITNNTKIMKNGNSRIYVEVDSDMALCVYA